jgi:hypothetical protein
MNQLKCDAQNCLYNQNQLCSAEEIKVQGGDTTGGSQTFCGTFNSKSVGNYVSSLGNMNYGGAIQQMVSSGEVMEPKVFCNAVNCTYNSEQICQADHVQIQNPTSSTAEQTECQTFYPRNT